MRSDRCRLQMCRSDSGIRQNEFVNPASRISIPGTRDVVDFAEFGADSPRAPIRRVRSDGSIAWSVEPPESQDSWVTVVVDGDRVTATSWSCWRVTVDVHSGREIDRVFTK